MLRLLIWEQVSDNGSMTTNTCRVFWGSHGCELERGHAGHHECDCCDCPNHEATQGHAVDEDGDEFLCVGKHPYFGPSTRFFGEDAV